MVKEQQVHMVQPNIIYVTYIPVYHTLSKFSIRDNINTILHQLLVTKKGLFVPYF